MKNKVFIFWIATFFIAGCGRYLHQIRQNSYGKKSVEYRKSNGFIETKSDASFTIKNEELHYREGCLYEVGKIKDNKRYGKWYIFSDSVKLKYVVKHRRGRVDTLLKPMIRINQSW